MTQTAVEWLYETIDNELIDFLESRIDVNELSVRMLNAKQQAKEMEKEQQNKMPIHIHEGISNTWVYIEDGVVHVKPNDLKMVKQCQFEIYNTTSSATKCKWCGQEKWQHKTYGGNK